MVWKDLEGNVTDIGQGVTCLPLHISSWNQKLIFKQISRIWTRYLTINIFQNESSYFSTSPAMLLSQTHCATDRSLIVPGLKHSALYTFPPPSMLLAFPTFSTSSEETCLTKILPGRQDHRHWQNLLPFYGFLAFIKRHHKVKCRGGFRPLSFSLRVSCY